MIRRRLPRQLPLLLLFALLFTALPATAAPQPQGGEKLEPMLVDELAAQGQADFVVGFVARADLSPAYSMDWEERGPFVVDALKGAAEQSQASAKAYLDARGLRHQTFVAGNELYVWAGDLATAQALAGLADVAYVHAARTYALDPVVAGAPESPQALDWGIADTKADQFWTTFGRQGDGIVVANIDTGVQWNHPALDQAYKCPADPGDAACWADPSNICGGVPCDNNGHGTHVMGTMVGDDDPGLSYQAGMAPNARWIACKGCESSSCSTFALGACADWLLAPGGDAANRPHVVNNSWGGAGGNLWYEPYVVAWRAAGVFPSFTGGNGGPGCGTLGSPGDYKEAFTTAVHDIGRAIAPFSGRGPSPFGDDPYTKPNTSAPGVDICSALPPDTWACWSGGAMASPHAAGAVALLWSCNPSLIGSVDITFRILQGAADAAPAGNCGAPPDLEGNYTFGYGYLNVLAAGLGYCAAPGALNGYVRDTSNAPLPGASVTAGPGGQTATTDAYGYYTMTLPEATYTVTAAMAGYTPQTVPGVVVVAGGTTTQDFALWQGGWITMTATPFQYTRFDCTWYDDGRGPAYPHNLKVYCMGGRTGSNTEDPSIWRYDPVTNVWSDTTRDVPVSVSNYTANLLRDEYSPSWGPAIYVIGGYDVDGATPGPVNTVQRYYPYAIYSDIVASDPWPAQVAGITVSGMGCATVANKIYCFGGWENTTAPYFSGQTWEYDPGRPAGSRWQQVVTANLNPPRAYLQVAVQNNLIYAMGGDSDYVGGDLVPTSVVEVLDTSNLAAGWVPRASMPVALGEGRGFGLQADTLGPGWVYTAGGGDWPGESVESMAYDVSADAWAQSFPDLNVPRRDQAGVYIPLCTPDGSDTMPALMVIGGRSGSDAPPFAVPEYFPLPGPCPAAPPVCQLFPPKEVRVGALDPVRAAWGSTDFQVLNLAPDAQPFVAQFVDPGGAVRYALADSLAGGETRDYMPEPFLPPGFSGTVVLTTPVRAAMAVVHLEPPPESGGNTVFSGVPDDFVGNSGYTPIDGCTRLYVHNMDPLYEASLQVYLLDAFGGQLAYDTYVIPPLGVVTVDPAAEHNLPPDFVGSVVLHADRLIRVTANSGCHGYAAFAVSPYCGDTLYAPYLPPNEPGWMTTSLVIQNPTDVYEFVAVSYSSGLTQPVALPPWHTLVIPSPLSGGGWAVIDAGGAPLVAVVRSESADPASPGSDAYRALALAESSRAVALPALFNGFQGWLTGNRIWVMNVGAAATRVTIRYCNTADGSLAWDRQVVQPGEVWRPVLPALPGERAAAIAVTDPAQPIIALGGAAYGAPELRDGQFTYAGTNFPFAYLPVSGASFTAAVAVNFVTFDGAVAAGDPPVDFAWDWGDGSKGVGQHTVHVYGAAGTYNVVMTATNALGFYVSTAVDTVTVAQGHSVYLPLVLRAYQP